MKTGILLLIGEDRSTCLGREARGDQPRRCLEKNTSVMFPWIPTTLYLGVKNGGTGGSQLIQILQQSQISKTLRSVHGIQQVRYPG